MIFALASRRSAATPTVPDWARWVWRAMATAPHVSPPLQPRFSGLTDGGNDAGNITDSQLVVAAKYGDPDAFDQLVARFAPVLHAVARRLVGDDLAQDVVQDSLLAAFRNLGRYRGDATFSSYLHGIVVNRCRRVGRRVRPWHSSGEVLESTASSDAGPAELSENAELRHSVEAAVRGLPAPFRETLALREFGELGYDEIAQALGVPVGTVRSRLARARSMLRDDLKRAGVRP